MANDTQRSEIPPRLFDDLPHVEPLIESARFGLVLDFDGTLSELVLDPNAAVIHPDALGLLKQLKGKLHFSAVMSGRAASDIQTRVGIEGMNYIGNHGAEYLLDGHTSLVEESPEHRPNVESLFQKLRPLADGEGMIWEDKGFSASVHYRMSPNRKEARSRLEAALTSVPDANDLDIFWGNMVLEIRARAGINKGFAIRKVVQDWNLESVAFFGDDTTDGDALLALADLKSEGQVNGFGVAVIQDGTPDVVLQAADYSVNGVPGVVRFLTWLNQRLS